MARFHIHSVSLLSIIILFSACSESPQTNSESTIENPSVKTPIENNTDQKSIVEIERDAELRMRNFTLPEGFEINLWADENQTQNPSFFSFDSQGRMLMVETARFTQGVDDIRGHENKTVEDIYITSNADRLAMYEKYQDERPMSYYRSEDDIIRLLQDTDGDGRADKANVFSDGYNDVLDGIGAGVIERDGKVYYTNIPHLWMLEDTDNDGVADSKTSLQDGFGIRISFYGHDLHGLIWGPDGKLYWSIGDRGFNITTKEGNHYFGPNLGGVFRADPDGSNIEYFYNGLRNPQELAFDDYGNLFTADNDGDGGDTERVNYLVEGGDSGWHAGHQSIMSFTDRLKLRSAHYTGDNKIPNAWMTQEMYVPRNDKQPAFMLPAIGKLNGGPSGLVHNPGMSFGEKYKDNFFVIHYLGSPAQSYISTFTTKEDGAGFIMDTNKLFLQGFNAVDLDFGPDGAMYISEYNYGGWQPEEQGAVYRLQHPDYTNTSDVKAVQAILTSDFSAYTVPQLKAFISHGNQRVRQKAQFELAKKGKQGWTVFQALATNTELDEIQRIHGIWGLSQMAYYSQQKAPLLDSVMTLLNDENAQVRIQASRVMGDHRYLPSAPALLALLQDSHPRVAMYAGIGLGRMSYDAAASKVIDALLSNKDQDLFLRHGLVMALVGLKKESWWQYHNHASKYVRMAVLLTARRALDPDIAIFLQDKEAAIVDEAITAINDLSIESARGKLAELLESRTKLPANEYPTDQVGQWEYHRIINANYAQGSIDDASRLLNFAATEGLPTRLASEALSAIEAWNDINPIDTTTGLPTKASKSRDDISALVTQKLPTVLANVQGAALVQSIRLAQQNNINIPSEVLRIAAFNENNEAAVRLQSLSYLVDRKVSNIKEMLLELSEDNDAHVRGSALEKLYQIDEQAGFVVAQRFLESGQVDDKQVAYTVMQESKIDAVDSIVLKDLNNLLQSQTPDGATLELLALAESRQSPQIQTSLARYKQFRDNASTMTKYAASLFGGNAEKGQQIFSGGGATECLRCHIVNWTGGKAGPELSNIGAERSREYLLESIVDVQAAIAPGYGTMVITLQDGQVISGIYQGETESIVKLELQDKEIHEYAKTDIIEMQRPASGMPPMNLLLDEFQIRDLVAYLAQLEYEWEKVEEVH